MKGLLRPLVRADEVLERVERAVLAGGVIGIALLGIANVVARNLLGGSLAYAEEMNQILVIAVTFLGLGHGVREGRHIRMSAVYDLLQGRVRKSLLLVTWTGTGLLLAYLTFLSVRYVADVRDLGSLTPALRMPWWIFYALVPVGLGVASLQYLLAVARNLATPGLHHSLRREERYEEVPPAGDASGW